VLPDPGRPGMLGRALLAVNSQSSGVGSGSASATGTAIPCASRRKRDKMREPGRNLILAFGAVAVPLG